MKLALLSYAVIVIFCCSAPRADPLPLPPPLLLRTDSPSLQLKLTTKAIDTLFAFEPFFAFATDNARKKIVDRADSLGVGWGERVDGMRRSMDELQAEYDGLLDDEVRMGETGGRLCVSR